MDKVINFLSKNSIEYILHEHPAVFTCEEADKYCSKIPGVASKNLFLRNKKASRIFLLVLPADKRADLKKFAKIVGENKISFAGSELLYERLDLSPGSVSPFGLINDNDSIVEVYIDNDVYDADIVSFHPNDNKATLELSKEMFGKFLEALKHKINIIEL